MADGAPPSRFLGDALQYLASLRLLIEADRAGRLADPDAVERTIQRAEAAIAHVMGTLHP